MSEKIVSRLGCMDRRHPKFCWPWGHLVEAPAVDSATYSRIVKEVIRDKDVREKAGTQGVWAYTEEIRWRIYKAAREAKRREQENP